MSDQQKTKSTVQLVGQDPKELLVLVDEHGVATGTAPRWECHGPKRLRHGVSRVLVFRSNGALLMQKRSRFKDSCPGMWDTSVGGHMAPGETPLQTAVRETREELGLDPGIDKFEFLYKHAWESAMDQEVVFTFRVSCDACYIADPAEVEKVRDWSTDEIREAWSDSLFTPAFNDEWRKYQAWLKA